MTETVEIRIRHTTEVPADRVDEHIEANALPGDTITIIKNGGDSVTHFQRNDEP